MIWRKITKDELEVFLRKHKLWLDGNPAGERANLYGADLCEANLRGADLCEANLYGANLYRADLYGANLYGADLYGADLCEANLRGANLCEANLRGANLYGADLCEANLRGANLYGANLYRADLYGANLYGANLYRADLCEANLRGEKNVNYPIACPEKGSFIAFKTASGYIIELEIPADALRSSATGRKCRCSKAKVVSITNLDGDTANVSEIVSNWDSNFIYKLGETIEVSEFDTDRWNECAPGIHFFITRQEAVDWATR